MLKKFVASQEKGYISKGTIAGAITGGILGAMLGFFNTISLPIDSTIIGAVLGVFIGGGIGYIIQLYIQGKNSNTPEQVIHTTDNAKLQIREEQLDISKKWIQTGEVTMHKEVVTEEKNIVVPVTREELVIEKKVLDGEGMNEMEENTDTIRIPISEERIEVIKHPTALEDVTVYKRQFQENERIEETVKKEKLHISEE